VAGLREGLRREAGKCTPTYTQVLSTAPHLGLPQLHDFVFQMFALCMFTPECTVIALMLVIRILSYHPHLRVTSRNCKRLLLCAMMIAQKYWDDTPLRNVDFSVAWSRVQPAERPCPIDRINAMECVFLGALGFDLYIPEVKYVACIEELVCDTCVSARAPFCRVISYTR